MEQKNISFDKGISRSPFPTGEGEMAECVNLIPERGELVNIQPPKELGITLLDSETVVYVHTSGTYTHYIVHDKEKSTLAWYDEKGTRKIITDTLKSYTDINSVGNTLIVLTENKRMFFLYENDEYKPLGDLPELPDIELRLFSKTTERKIPSDSPCRWMYDLEVSIKGSDDEKKQVVMNTIYALTNSLREIAYKKGLFIYPFKICYALTYYDGSIARCSAPILMAPSTYQTFSNYMYDISKDPSKWMAIVQTCRLFHRITFPDNILDWKDIIKSIDYYITAPVQTLDDTADYANFQLVSLSDYTDNPIGIYTNDVNEAASIHNIPFYKGKDGNILDKFLNSYRYVNLPYRSREWIDTSLMRDGTFYFLASENLGEAYEKQQNGSTCYIIPDKRTVSAKMSESGGEFLCPADTVMTGRSHSGDENKDTMYEYASLKAVDANGHSVSGKITVEEVAWEDEVTESDHDFKAPANRVIVGRKHSSDENGKTRYATAVVRFNGMATTTVDSITSSEITESDGTWFNTDRDRVITGRSHHGDENGDTTYTSSKIRTTDWIPVPETDKTLSTIENQKTMPLEYFSNADIIPQKVFTYNGRANYYNIYRTMFKGYSRFFEWVSQLDNVLYTYRIYVRIKTDTGQERVVMREFSTRSQIGTYFYYPDPGAYEAVIEKYKNVMKVGDLTLKLIEHPTLNGAYYFAGFPVNSDGSADVNARVNYNLNLFSLGIEVNDAPTYYSNKIYTSEVDNPFSIGVENINTIGTGDILAVSTATKALSQGQFGQFPLYVFCSDGIYTMQVGDTGTFSSIHPVSRDVCNNPASVTQLDSAVVFTTGKGLMLLEGSTVTLISEKMDGQNTDETMYNVQAGLEELFVTDTVPFTSMLKTCILSYDYPHGLLHIFPADGGGKHHVLSLSTGEFSSYVGYDIKAARPAYPHNIIQIGNRLHTFDRLDDPATIRRGMLLTRPISFGNPMALKVLADLRMLYNCTSEQTKCRIAVWVSNDLLHWFRMKSLRAGSYKWYRFAIFTGMTDNDALVGLTAMTEERRSHKLR